MTTASERTGDSTGHFSLYRHRLDRLIKRTLFTLLDGLQYGRLTIRDQDETRTFGTDDSLQATLYVTDPSVFRHILFGGSVAAGKSYIDNGWYTSDLTSLVRIMVLNSSVLDRIERYFSFITEPIRRIKHLLNNNTRQGSKKNILAHYDLGNSLYRSFLDSSMMYSSAIYPHADSTLEEASHHKLDLICRKLSLTPSDRIIEIGSGWGGFAIYAATHYGCHVTTTTISDAQYREARRRIKAAGLTDRITLLKKDYRDLTGHFDKLVSIEMIEAVGNNHLAAFFRKCCALLKSDGMMLLQAITIADQKFDSYLKQVDFIQKYIFPGGFLPSNTRMLSLIKRETDCVVRSINDYGFHYARTLQDWRKRFFAAFPRLEKEGFDERFRRLWEFYLCYCEGGFLERSISVIQLTATRPLNRSGLDMR